GDDLGLLLVAEEPILARMRIETADGDPRSRPAQAAHRPLGEVDDLEHPFARDEVGHPPERHVGSHVYDLQLLAHEEHREVRGPRELGQDLRVARVLDTGGGQRLLVDGGGYEAVDLSRLAELHPGLDVGVWGTARLRAHARLA